jgi:hypothetical protein
MKLSTAEITEVYEEIGQMRVQLDPNPNRGLQYVKERLTLCRAMQDRLGELLLLCSRAYSDVLTEELSVKTDKQLNPPPPDTTIVAQRLVRIAADKEEHATLVKMLKLQHTLLGRTSQDIRLLADLTKEQIKLGEIDPHEAGLVEHVPPEDLSPVPHVPPVDSSADQSSTLGPPSAIIESMNTVVALPQFPGPDLPVMTTEPVTNYEELFGALNGKHSNGEHS